VFEKARAEFALPETEVAEQAYRFAEQIEPAFVFAHSVRSYLYPRELAGAGAGIRDRESARWPRSTRWKELRSRSSYSLRRLRSEYGGNQSSPVTGRDRGVANGQGGSTAPHIRVPLYG
jgi:hypothetical protein